MRKILFKDEARTLSRCSLIIAVFEDTGQAVSQKFAPREIYKYPVVFLISGPRKG